ncbi:MAG: tRNA 2-thiouridine(34) synthase MnmA [Bacteroidaceae bacterium]|nr:tRNA 2-thiouridine(34) synthase MnmA [Bacteroidaceae bacterium]
MNCAVLISGGVDSAVVTHLLCEQGYRPDLHYIRIGMEGEDSSCTADEDIELSQATARMYGLHLEVTDLQQEYWDRVVGYAIERVKQGLTPNPDVMCNSLIKFGAFEERIGHQYDFVATGHYATNIERDGMMWLGTAVDPVKDQTDFLAQLSYAQLSHTRFPLGPLMKEEVRQIALDARLPSARRKDSQGICFLGKINYNDFVRRFMGEKEGKVIDIETGKTVGTHRGYWFHTIGQRKGLGLGGGPWFVVKKNIRKNIIFVAHGWDTQLQYGHDFRLADLHFITANPWQAPVRQPIQFKVRHVDHFMPGLLTLDDEGYHIHSDAPIQGIAPGQFGCIYDADARICYGSGEISIYKER